MMNPGQAQIKPETVALIASLAEANGLSVDEYLHRILEEVAHAHGVSIDAFVEGQLAADRQAQRQAEPLNLAELDRLLDELAQGTNPITPLPPGFSRADIYGDHA